jgi:hypothetical protein
MPCLESKRARRRPEGPAPTIIIWGSEREGLVSWWCVAKGGKRGRGGTDFGEGTGWGLVGHRRDNGGGGGVEAQSGVDVEEVGMLLASLRGRLVVVVCCE